jgi:hypothetical protein
VTDVEQLKLFYRTMGEDYDITAQSVGMDLQRSIAMGLCYHTTHHPKPCLTCITLVKPLVKPFGRALAKAALFERKDRMAGYVALGKSLDVLGAEVNHEALR